jgi:hypothetical protein
MKLNLERIKELEEEYNGNSISLNTLQQMIDQVMYPTKDLMTWRNESVYNLALSTLTELGVIANVKDSKQLNS